MNENTLQFLADILVEWGSAGAVGAVLATILCRHFGKSWIDSKFAVAFAEVVDADDPTEQLNDDSLRAVQAVSFITAAKEATQARQKSSIPGEANNFTGPPPTGPEPQPERTPTTGIVNEMAGEAQARRVRPIRSSGKSRAAPPPSEPEPPLQATAAGETVNNRAKEAQARPPRARSSKAEGIKSLASAPAEPEPTDQVVTDAGRVNPGPEPPSPGATLTFMESGLKIVGLPPDRPNLPPVYALHGSAGMMRRGNWETILASARKHAGGDDLGPFVVQRPKQQIQPSRPDQKPFARPT